MDGKEALRRVLRGAKAYRAGALRKAADADAVAAAEWIAQLERERDEALAEVKALRETENAAWDSAIEHHEAEVAELRSALAATSTVSLRTQPCSVVHKANPEMCKQGTKAWGVGVVSYHQAIDRMAYVYAAMERARVAAVPAPPREGE